MAENEAIEELREQVETAEFMISFNMDFELKHDNSVLENKIKTAKIANSALEEIQQYRAIGTVEEIKDILQIISDGQDDVDESGISTGLLHTLLEYAEYKNIGTVEEIKDILQIISDGQDDVDESGISTGLLHTLLEYAEYKKIGTVEECREARERQKPKKPILYKNTNRADCPVCGNTVRGISKPFGGWCSHCGCKLDWSE